MVKILPHSPELRDTDPWDALTLFSGSGCGTSHERLQAGDVRKFIRSDSRLEASLNACLPCPGG